MLIGFFFRIDYLLFSKQNGYSVHIATEITDKFKDLSNYGFFIHKLKFNRSSTSLKDSFKTFLEILKFIK